MPDLINEGLETQIEVNEWRPNSKPQATFLGLPDDIFEGCYGGAAGGGKTEALLYLPITKRFHQHPSYKGITFRRTYKQLEESLIPRAREIYEKFGARYNDTKHMFTFPSGARHYLSYLETDEDARQFDTSEFNLVEHEELTHFAGSQYPEYQYIRLISRCRTSTNLPAIMRSGATPGNVGHAWVKERFITPYRTGGVKLYDSLSNTYRIFIRALGKDNKDLLEKDPNYFNRLRLLPIAEAKALIEGDWDSFLGQVFTEFRLKPGMNEPSYAQHVISSFPIPNFWPKIIAIDWGFAHDAAIYWLAVAHNGKVYVYREHVVNKQYIETWASDVARMSRLDENIVDVVIDPSANQRRGELRNIKEQVCDALQMPITDADNDRVGGRLLIHEYLRWENKPPKYVPSEGFSQEIADRIFRQFGPVALSEYIEMFQEEQLELNLPKLQIFDTCQRLIEKIPQCVFDDKKPEDIKKFHGDDPIDSIRYGIKRVHLFLQQSQVEFKKHDSLTRIITNFAENKDYTKLARQMEVYEAATKTIPMVRKKARPTIAGSSMYRVH